VTIGPTLEDMQRAGFLIGGEPLVALDLVNTMVAVPQPTDGLAAPGREAIWWDLQSARLPDGPVPDPAATRRLRAAVRDLLDRHLEGRPAQSISVEDVNAAAGAVPSSVRLVLDEQGLYHAETRWHIEHGGNPKLAAIARETIVLLSDPARLALLRQCANISCSMLFLAQNRRRQWCASNVCGNRARVARHYERTHAPDRRHP